MITTICEKEIDTSTYYQSPNSDTSCVKLLNENTEINANNSNEGIIYDLDDYSKNPTLLVKFKLIELKQIAKSHKLHVSGNKTIIKERIIKYFLCVKSAKRIQSIFRGHIVRLWIKLHSNNYKSNDCVNETDFYTLEPLNTILFENWYSYTDTSGFKYGFDMYSLIELSTQNMSDIRNPYTREAIPKHDYFDLYTLACLNYIMCPSIAKNKHVMKNPRLSISAAVNNDIAISQRGIRRLHDVRMMSVTQRIIAVFIEIDRLGNYTNYQWFSELNKLQYARFYTMYSRFWSRSLSDELKRNLNVTRNPFSLLPLLQNYSEHTESEYREACLDVIETMVYTGLNEDFRKLSTIHILSMLAHVSPAAMLAMPWFYT